MLTQSATIEVDLCVLILMIDYLSTALIISINMENVFILLF